MWQQLQSVSVWCWCQDRGDLRSLSLCPMRPHHHRSPSSCFSIFCLFLYFFPEWTLNKCDLCGTCGILADLQYPPHMAQHTCNRACLAQTAQHASMPRSYGSARKHASLARKYYTHSHPHTHHAPRNTHTHTHTHDRMHLPQSHAQCCQITLTTGCTIRLHAQLSV